jgi:MFS family permease
VSPTFRALRIPNYRLWATGALVSNTGTWMQRVAQDWLVLTVLTHNSGVATGITTGLQFAPIALLAPVSGAVADRLDRRRLLMATQALCGVLALVLGVLVVADVARLWHVYLLAGLLGVVAAFDGPARQAFVSEMVDARDLPNAVGLNSASFHAGRLIGPGIAGLLIARFGTGPVFLINAVSFGAVLLSLQRMSVADLRPAPRVPRGSGAVRAGLAYVRHRPDLVVLLSVVGMVGTFGLNFQLTTALMARTVFDKGSGAYGLLGSIMAIGSLGGALLAARREHPTLRLVLGATALFGLAGLVASAMPTYVSFAVALIPVGLAALTVMTAANAAVQLSTAPELRGRVMALYMAIFMGGTPVGAPLVGWIGEQFGARWTIAVGGLVSLATAAVAAVWMVTHRELRTAPAQRPAASPQAERVGEELVADERDDVEQGVRDHQGHDPAAAAEPLAEDHSHHGVADERAEALVQVVAPAQESAGGEPGPVVPAEVLQPGHQVPDDHHLLDHGVLDGLQHEHRHRPPVRRQCCRNDVGRDAQCPSREVQGQAG